MRAAAIAIPVLLVAAAAAAGVGGPSPVVYPPQRLPLSFTHDRHAGRGLACLSCHAEKAASTGVGGAGLPGETACVGCHEIRRGEPSAACARCHPGWSGAGQPARVAAPAAHLRFSHRIHLERGAACATCHPGVETRGLATRDDLPRMPVCLACHDGRRAQSRCATCHPSTPGGQVTTTFPEGLLRPSGTLRGDAHDAAFAADHRRAGADAAYCQSCHAASDCSACHDGRRKPASLHGPGYLRVHSIEARRGADSCRSCHRPQTFCVGCHARSGVANDPRTSEHARRLTPGQPGVNPFHPASWGERDGGRPPAHALDARRSLSTCTSCHRESDCGTCHGTVRPHPVGWESRRCQTLRGRNPRVCSRCHVTTVPKC